MFFKAGEEEKEEEEEKGGRGHLQPFETGADLHTNTKEQPMFSIKAGNFFPFFLNEPVPPSSSSSSSSLLCPRC